MEAVEYPALELPILIPLRQVVSVNLELGWSFPSLLSRVISLHVGIQPCSTFHMGARQTHVSKLMSKSSSFPEPSLQALFEIVLLVSQTGLKLMNFSDPLATAFPRAETESKSQLSSRIEALQDATL